MSRSTLIALFVAAVLLLAACDLPAPASPTMRMTPDQIQEHLDAAWRALDRGGRVLWTAVNSPYFPAEWPPTKTTVWTMYAYAQGMEPGLADAVRISAAWARVERKPGDEYVKAIDTLTRLDVVGTQGNAPLSAGAAATLAQRDAVTEYALKLIAAPVESDPAAASMRAYYREWLRANGVFAAQIAKSHEAFFAWTR